jgi:hypothetical protein
MVDEGRRGFLGALLGTATAGVIVKATTPLPMKDVKKAVMKSLSMPPAELPPLPPPPVLVPASTLPGEDLKKILVLKDRLPTAPVIEERNRSARFIRERNAASVVYLHPGEYEKLHDVVFHPEGRNYKDMIWENLAVWEVSTRLDRDNLEVLWRIVTARQLANESFRKNSNDDNSKWIIAEVELKASRKDPTVTLYSDILDKRGLIGWRKNATVVDHRLALEGAQRV